MVSPGGRRLVIGAAVLVGIFLSIKYVLPIALPFGLGFLLALAAEPAVRLGCRLRLKRSWAAGLGVSATLVMLFGVVSFLGALAVRELLDLSQEMPDIQKTALEGSRQLQVWLTDLAMHSPQSLQPLLVSTVEETFDGGNALFSRVAERIPTAVTDVIAWLPKGTVSLFVTVLSGFMISARLPKLRQLWRERLPKSWTERYLPMLRQTRRALGGWLKAQGKLMLITWGIVSVGLFALKVPYGLLWAALIALVDAVPVLGTGTVLIPWALVCFLQGNMMQGVGLLVTYGAALITRTVLEPKLVGNQLGLDPLLTLVAFYTGFALFGFLGMLLAPVLAGALGTVLRNRE